MGSQHSRGLSRLYHRAILVELSLMFPTLHLKNFRQGPYRLTAEGVELISSCLFLYLQSVRLGLPSKPSENWRGKRLLALLLLSVITICLEEPPKRRAFFAEAQVSLQ